jgi:hypothetical protein
MQCGNRACQLPGAGEIESTLTDQNIFICSRSKLNLLCGWSMGIL